MKAPRRGLWRSVDTVDDRLAAHSPAQTYTLLQGALTCSVTAWRLPCCAPGRRWGKSEKSFGIETPTQRKSTPRLTSRACGHWLIPGRWEVHSETTGTGIERLPPHPPQPWVPTPGAGKFVTEFCGVSPSRGQPYITTELALRWATQPAKAQPATWARAFGDGPALRHLAQRHRPSHRDSTRGPSPASLPPQAPSHL